MYYNVYLHICLFLPHICAFEALVNFKNLDLTLGS